MIKKTLPIIFFLGLIIPSAYASNCIELGTCMPTNPPDVLNLYDQWYGTGFTILAMAMIIGMITVVIYVRTRSLPMLGILGAYEIAVFSSIITSKYVASQYQIAIYVIGIALATAVTMMIMRLVKE